MGAGRLKSPALRLFTQPFLQAQIKENFKAPRHWPLWGEFPGDWSIPRTKGQSREKLFHLMTSSWNTISQEGEAFSWPLIVVLGRGGGGGGGGGLKNLFQLLNLRVLIFSPENKMLIFQCMGNIFCVEFYRVPLMIHTKYLTHKMKDANFIQRWNFKSS